VAACAALALLSACSKLPTYRYEMTVEVETPAGVRQGSSVIEVSGHTEPKLLPNMIGFDLNVAGEAAAVDLPNGETLFALLAASSLEGGDPIRVSRQLLSPTERSRISQKNTGEVLSLAKRSTVLSPNTLPLLVVLERKDDVKSLRIVSPESIAPSIRLKKIRVATTEKNSAPSLLSRYPVLKQFESVRLGPSFPRSHRIEPEDFSTFLGE
jgi:hypothetical protein